MLASHRANSTRALLPPLRAKTKGADVGKARARAFFSRAETRAPGSAGRGRRAACRVVTDCACSMALLTGSPPVNRVTVCVLLLDPCERSSGVDRRMARVAAARAPPWACIAPDRTTVRLAASAR
jgi:hypothetical protein